MQEGPVGGHLAGRGDMLWGWSLGDTPPGGVEPGDTSPWWGWSLERSPWWGAGTLPLGGSLGHTCCWRVAGTLPLVQTPGDTAS